MKILAIETATDICGVCYHVDGTCIDIVESSTPRKHAEKLPLFIEKLFTKNKILLKDIDAIALSNGPGSFTGLRIGLSYSKGLAYSHGLPLIPVPTLLAMIPAEKWNSVNNVLLYSHGKMVFYQHTTSGETERPVSLDFHDVPFDTRGDWYQYGCSHLTGDKSNIHSVNPSAEYIGDLASKFVDKWIVRDPKQIVPDYISPFKIQKKK